MLKRNEGGFTLIELMIVVLIIGILAAIAIPNFLAMQNRAKEGGVKNNMHTFQQAAEDYALQNNGFYAKSAADVATGLPVVFKNPWTQLSGDGKAWMDGEAASVPGIVGYKALGDSAYVITGFGKMGLLNLKLSGGVQ